MTDFPLSSCFFEGSSPIDNVYQSLIDLKINHPIEIVENVLENSLLALDTNLDYNLLIELSSLIEICFSYYPNQLTQFFHRLLESSKKNFNHIYTLTSVLLILPEYQSGHEVNSFLHDCLQQVFPQIQNNSKNIQIFGFEISPQFTVTFIINLYLLSDTTKEMLPDISSYIFSQKVIDSQKIELFIQKVIKSNMVSFLSPLVFSNVQLMTMKTIEELYKVCENLPENFFRELFDEFQKVCLNHRVNSNKFFIAFINKGKEYNLDFNDEIEPDIKGLGLNDFKIRKNFSKSSSEQNENRSLDELLSGIKFENNTQFWIDLMTILLNTKNSIEKNEILHLSQKLRKLMVDKKNINEVFDLIILTFYPLNHSVTSLLVKILHSFQNKTKKKYFSLDHQRELLSKVISKEKVPHPQFWDLISHESIVVLAKERTEKNETIEPLLMYAIHMLNLKINNCKESYQSKYKIELKKLTILQQNENSYQEVENLAFWDYLSNLFGTSLESLSLVMSSYLFKEAKNKIEIELKDKISILPFISLMKSSPKNSENTDLLNHELYDTLSNEDYLNSYKNTSFFINSIERIVGSNAKFDFTISKIMTPLILSDQYKGYKFDVLKAIYRLSNNSNTTKIDNFFNENGLNIINFSLHNLFKINYLENEKVFVKFNFNCIKSNEIKAQIIELIESRSNIEISQLKQFILKNCLNSPKINFGKIEKLERSVDDIITNILSFINSSSNDDEASFCISLFDIFMREKNNAINYFNILFEKVSKKEQKVTPKILLGFYKEMYDKYKDYFIESVNRFYIYNPLTNELIKKNVNDFEKPFSEKSLLIISKLYGLINGNSYNDSKVFTVLQSIASSFPFLFTTNTTQLFELVLSKLEKSKENILDSKDAIICLSFLQSCLYSTKILDDFINWSFEKITSYNISQITGLFVLINSIFTPSSILKKVFISCVTKFNFIEKINSLLSRDDKPKNQHKILYNEAIFKFLINFYRQLFKISKFEIMEAQELLKVDNPVCCGTGFSLTFLPCKINVMDVDNYKTYNRITSNSDLQQLSISYSHSIEYITDDIVSKFVSEINSSDQSKILKANDQISKENDNDSIDIKDIYKDFIDKNYSKALFKSIINLKSQYIKNNQFSDTINKLLDVFNSYFGSIFIFFECLNEEIIDVINNRSNIDFKYLIEIAFYYNKSKYFCEVINRTCSKNLVYASLMEKNRNNYFVCQFMIRIYSKSKVKIPDCLIFFVNYVFLSCEELSIAIVFDLFPKIDKDKMCLIYDSISFSLSYFLQEKYISFDILNKFITNVPNLIKERSFDVLDFIQKKYSIYQSIKRKKFTDLVINLLFMLVPERNESFSSTLSGVITENYSSKIIPENIFQNSPKFWQTFEIFYSIDHKNFVSLSSNYPELFSFQERFIYFKQELNKIKQMGVWNLSIDRSNIIESSIDNFKRSSHDEMLKRLNVTFLDEKGSDYGGLTKDWLTNLIKEIFDPKNGYFKVTENKNSFEPNPSCKKLEYFKFFGQIIAISIINDVYINAHLVKSFIKQILHHELKFNDLEFSDGVLYNSLNCILENKIDGALEMYFIVYSINEENGNHEELELVENGKQKEVTDLNKNQYVNLIYKYYLYDLYKDQIKEFCEGFESLIPHKIMRIFTSSELDLLICGTPKIDIEDMKKNIKIIDYDKDSPTIKFFFDAIAKWDQNDLAKLLIFFTGSSQVPATGFVELANSGNPLSICRLNLSTDYLPVSHTCFNRIDLPPYESEELLNRKLLFVVNECNDFGLI